MARFVRLGMLGYRLMLKTILGAFKCVVVSRHNKAQSTL